MSIRVLSLVLFTLVVLAHPGTLVYGSKGEHMSRLELRLDGSPVQLSPASVKDVEEALVPLAAFCDVIGAESKVLDGTGVLAVCRDDLCIPLSVGDTRLLEGETYARLSAFAGPLGLEWKFNNGALAVTTGNEESVGLGIGSHPPAFTLPDLFTGESVSPADYLGKRAVFFMWASW